MKPEDVSPSTTRQAADDDLFDAPARLQEILDGPREGVICGVRFDFRHDKIPTAELWHCSDGATPFGIAFPWDGDDPDTAARLVTSGANARGWGVTHVRAGDTVSVRAVTPIWRASSERFGDDHDAHSLQVHLVVTRSDGTSEDIENSICFSARDAMAPFSPHCGLYECADEDAYAASMGDFLVTYDKISRRIDRLSTKSNSRKPNEWIDLALAARGAVEESREELEVEFRLREAADPFPSPLQELIDLAATVGYALAKAESAPAMENISNRTRPATLARRTKGDPVRAAAREDIQANPRTSQTACATRVAGMLGKDQRHVERIIRTMFRWYELPGGGREKRPWPHLTKAPADRRLTGLFDDLPLPSKPTEDHS